MKINGWANRQGASGYSFGVYIDSNPYPLPEDSPLFEVFRQALDALIAGKTEGVVCGKKIALGTTGYGGKAITVESTWGSCTISEKKNGDGYSISYRLPFGGDENISTPSPGRSFSRQESFEPNQVI